MKISVCAEIFYYGQDLGDSIEKVCAAGAETVEFWNWANKDLSHAKEVIDKHGINVSGFCVGSKNPEIASQIPDSLLNSGIKEAFLIAIKESVEAAKMLGAKFLIITLGCSIEGISYEEQMQNAKECIEYAKDYLEESGIVLVLEPINRTERPTYLEPCVKPFIELVKSINSPCVKILYDIYHQVITGDFSLEELIDNIDCVGHIHIADVPGRGEPGSGTIDFSTILKEIDKTDYKGYIGLECESNKPINEILNDLNNLLN